MIPRPEPRPARIVYVEGNTDGTVGGSYFSLLFLVAGLDRARFAPHVVFQRDHALMDCFRAVAEVSLVDKPAPFRLGRLTSAAAKGVPRLALAPFRVLQSGVNFLRFLGTALRYRRVLRDARADLLHLNNSITRTHDWMLAARLAGIPCVCHERGINDRFPFPTRALTPRLAAVFCISQAVYDNLLAQGFAADNLHVVANGLDPAEVAPARTPDAVRAAHGIPPGRRLIGMVGNIRGWKGQEVLVRALPRIVAAVPDVTCLFVGETIAGDDYRRRLDDLIAAEGLGDHVVFTGYTRTPADYVNAMEVAVHASITPEPFGRVLLEAMALRKPVVGSRGGAVTEIVVDGVTGRTFPPGDSDALAAAVIELLQDRAKAARYGEAGLARLVSDFHIDRNVDRTTAIYARILGPG